MLIGIDLSPTLLARLARECPSIVGCKDTVIEFSSYYTGADVPCSA
jgi:dihydrodipicolinate synthase/N-acetylneuraminate lyase